MHLHKYFRRCRKLFRACRGLSEDPAAKQPLTSKAHDPAATANGPEAFTAWNATGREICLENPLQKDKSSFVLSVFLAERCGKNALKMLFLGVQRIVHRHIHHHVHYHEA